MSLVYLFFHHPSSRIHIVPVQPWGKFVNALNALTQCAVVQGFDHILFQSAETHVGQEGVEALMR